jgi:predicted dehydrogenase
MRKKINRRQFIKGTAATAAAASMSGYWISGVQTWADELKTKSPNEKINFASIGVGGKGDSDSAHVAYRGNLVAICDTDANIRAAKNKKLQKDYDKAATEFDDFRVMFDKMGKEIDAVTISIPDHNHAVATMMAIKAGKHVYTQKPMTHDVWEARQLRLAAKEHKVATQMGNQGTAGAKLREGAEMVRAGMLGDVTEVHIWTNRPVWPQSPDIKARPEPAPVPKWLNWDCWLGTAPDRPYTAEKAKVHNDKPYYHSFNWRGWWDFGTGALGDMGCHTANMPFMALNLGHPTSVQGESEPLNPETYPGWARAVYEFPARGDMKACRVNWYEGHKDGILVHPPMELAKKVLEHSSKKETGKKDNATGLPRSGSIIVGTKGIMYSPHDYGGYWELAPEEFGKAYKAPPQTIQRSMENQPDPADPTGKKKVDIDQANKDEWIVAIRGGPASVGNFDYAGMLTEFILLGNCGIKAQGKKLEFDGPNMKFTNAPEFDKLLKRTYRAPWTL